MPDYEKMSDAELDAAVAEKVMGFKWHLCHELNEQGEMVYHFRNDEPPEFWKRPTEVEAPKLPEIQGVRRFVFFGVPNYATDISAAWEVVERMRSANPADSIARWRFDLRIIADQFFVSFNNRLGGYGYSTGHDPAKVARSICLAALAAVEAKEKTNG